ncbi:MAG: hypothetical protein M1838_003189 [Thelocarpon superellum]|nr:MAG: hypothetical protein M1838_003189 [Thelocarpon superellum]
MPAIGPTLPPSLAAKRKHEEDDEELGPARPPAADEDGRRSVSPATAEKRRRVLGPSLPPPSGSNPVAERAPSPPREGDDESSSDDGFGPALPPATAEAQREVEVQRQRWEDEVAREEQNKKPQREEWMLVPPTSDDWSSRVDPTKLRNRKFNTGKGAKAPVANAGAEHALWTETPEQKRQRLANEVMGVTKPATEAPVDAKSARRMAEDEETARQVQEYNKTHRHGSLYHEHKKAGPREKEDDPSQRAFDREKDIGGGQKIGHAKRKELLNRAADFGSKFARGSFL